MDVRATGWLAAVGVAKSSAGIQVMGATHDGRKQLRKVPLIAVNAGASNQGLTLSKLCMSASREDQLYFMTCGR